MARRGPSSKAIALWRFSVIETLLDKDLSRHQHSRLVIRISRTPVRWPDGSDRRPSQATLYRWVALYSSKGFDGLKPRPRRDRGQKKAMLPESVVDAALHALLADPLQPWTFLCEIRHEVYLGSIRPIIPGTWTSPTVVIRYPQKRRFQQNESSYAFYFSGLPSDSEAASGMARG